MLIDCHTHIFTKEMRDEYFARGGEIALVMQMPERMMKAPEALETVQSSPRLFLCACIDLKEDIQPQLEAIEARLEDWKVVGLKIYTCYQEGRATDEKLFPVYEFAEKHRLAVTFHTGLCSLVLDSEQDMEGCNALHIAKAAELFPRVNFVAAHMDDPRIDACCRLCSSHPNLFTDYSGLFEEGYEGDMDKLSASYGRAIRSSPGMEDHLLFGTDFCPPLNLKDIQRFHAFAKRVNPGNSEEKFYFQNALRAFPRLAEYLKDL